MFKTHNSSANSIKPTTVLQAVLFGSHLLCQLRQRLVDGVAASQRPREALLETLHLLHGALGKGRPEERSNTCVIRTQFALVTALSVRRSEAETGFHCYDYTSSTCSHAL